MTIRGVVANLFMKMCSIVPLQDKIVFSSFYGNTFGDNPEVIFNEVRKQAPWIKCIWLIGNPKLDINGAIVVNANSFAALYHLATSKLWIDNSRKKEWIYKRKNQYYVQTWHGDVCLKKIEKDAVDSIDDVYIKYAKHDSEIADLMLSGSDFRTRLFKESFWYNGEILEYGTPKSVVFYEDPIIYKNKVKKYFHVDSSIHMVIYCPTFRATDNLNFYDVDYDRLIKDLENKFGCEWIVLLRLHPKIIGLQNQLRYSNKVINASNYPSVEELIVASDLVITDYSACMFAGLEANKPVFLYATDVEDYINNDRGFYFDLKKLPFPLAQNKDELDRKIAEFDLEKYETEAKKIKNTLEFKTNINSTSNIVEYIIGKVWKGAN